MSYQTWQTTSTAYQAYLAAAERCDRAFQEDTMTDQPTITARAWTHPGTGEMRYYLDGESIAAAAGIDYRARTIAGETVTARDMTQARQTVEDSKFWTDEDGELHYRLARKAEGTYAARLVIDRVRAARIVKAEQPQRTERASARGTGWSKYSRPSNDSGVGAMLGRRSPARGTECHFCGLDVRTCDCR
ncbi:hypothetical protein [Glycomyces arizonensis]|uniref:hypothetical protein n=1 Tax=Glycomyces arizonensis TaxID=256035 RepID=UPI00041B3EE1|nr:hypothetical protein [Glycomyces arizonensis]